MASKARWQVAWLPEAVRGRTTLLSCTALGTIATLLLATPARSQPAANARPSGGVVSAGSATIGSSASTTTIRQSSQRTAIDWQSFDVGSHQTVDFIQPSSSAVALNRVISSNPSQIAGRIDANGQVILLNQSGVIFYQGAQVNTAGLIVSAAGMSNVNFMAGKLVFDQAANPNAAVVNQGSLTVKQAGLAALVAPQVANSGVITAKLGHVVLAGAKTATLDMYGDGMVSLDVNNAVTQAPVGRDGAPVAALVTNTGVIRADGGTVQLTAREADGLVQNLVQAGGTIRADSVGSKTGTVVLGGLGGSIVLSGVVTADGGVAPGSTGGQVQVDASQGVTLAAGSRIRASGPAGGGTVAIGTTLARAAGGPGTASALTAQTVQVDQGARVNASATGNGDGGRVTVLSSLSTSMAGNIYAEGGKRGGNGGFVEVSGGVLALTGLVNTSAPLGMMGTILLDPQDLVISTIEPVLPGYTGTPIAPNSTAPNVPANALPNATTNSWITPSSINGLTGAVVLQATRDLTVASPLDTAVGGTVTSLELDAGRNLTVSLSVKATDGVTLAAGLSTITGFVTSGSLLVNAAVTSVNGSVTLASGTAGSVTIAAAVSATTAAQSIGVTSGSLGIALQTGAALTAPAVTLVAGAGGIALNGTSVLGQTGATVDLSSTGGVSEVAGATLTAATLQSSGGISGAAADLNGTANAIGALGGFVVTGFSLSLSDTGALGVGGAVSASSVTIGGAAGSTPTGITLSGTGSIAAPTVTLVAGASGIALNGTSVLGQAGATVDLTTSGGGVTEASGASIVGATLQSSGGVSGTADLVGTANTIGTLSDSTVTGGNLMLIDNTNLAVSGAVGGNSLFIDVTQAGDTLSLGATAALSGSSSGKISLVADQMAATTGATLTGAGTVELAPFSAATTLTLGATGAELSVTPTLLGSISIGSTGTLVIGRVTPVSGFGTAEADGITIGASVTLGSSAAGTLDLESTGGVSEAGTVALSVGTLTSSGGITGGAVTLAGTANAIGTLGGFAVTGNPFSLSDTGALSVIGAVSASGGTSSVTIGGAAGSTPTGITLTGTGNIAAPTVTLSAGASGIALNTGASLGQIGATVDLSSTGGIDEVAGATITAATLQSSGGISGAAADLNGTANAIGALGGFAVTGFSLSLSDTGALSVGGAVSASGATSSVTIGGAAGSTPTGITLSGTGSIEAPTVTLVAGASGIALDGTSVLGQTGATVDLSSTGGVSEVAGATVTAATLQSTGGISGAAATLAGTANAIAGLGNFAVTGFSLSLSDTGALGVSGTVSASGGTSSVTIGAAAGSTPTSITLSGTGNIAAPAVTLVAGAGGIALNGTSVLGQTGATVDLSSTGGVSEVAGATLTAATLQSSGGISGAAADLNGTANAIGALGGFVVTGFSLSLSDTGALGVGGAVSASSVTIGGAAGSTPTGITLSGTGSIAAPTVTLVAGASGIALNGTSVLGQAGATVDLTTSGGGVTEASGASIVGATLQSSGGVSGTADLVGTANTIGTLSDSTVTGGNLMLIDNTNLAVSGAVGGNSLFIDVTQAGDTLSLGATAALSGSSSGKISLVADQMAATTGATLTGAGTVELAPFSAATTLTLGATGAELSVTPTLLGSISIGSTGTLVIGRVTPVSGFGTAEADGITIGASVTLGSSAAGTLDLESTGGVSEAGTVALSVGTLTSSGGITGGAVTLAGTANAIGTLGGFAVTGNPFSLSDTGALSVIGAVSASGGTSSVTIGGAAGSTPTGITLTGTGNIAAPTVTLSAGASGIALNTGASLGQIGATVDLSSTGGIDEVAGATITAATLQSSGGISGAAADLNGTANAIGALGGFAVTGFSLSLSDIGALSVGGAVSASGATSSVTIGGAAGTTPTRITLSDTGSIAAPTVALVAGVSGIALNGTSVLGQTGATVDLTTSGGGVSEASGASIVAATLQSSGGVAGTADLVSTANTIGTLSGFTVTGGDLVLVDDSTLTLTGALSANNLFFEVNVPGGALQIGSNTIGATLAATAVSNASISLVADNITEGAAPSSIATNGGTGGSGTVEVAPFTGSRPVSLAGASGSALVIDAGLIGIIDTGTVNVGRYTAVPAGGGFVTSAQSIVVAGSFDLTGHAATVGLYSQFGISVSAGEIVVGTLTGSAGEGAANLSANNLVGTLGPFTTFSGFALTDNGALTVVGPVTDSGTGPGVLLTTTTGGITLAGAINAAGDTLTLISAGSIVQTGGSIDVATLSGSAATSANLTQASNLIGAVGGFATAAGLALTDNEALTVSGPVSDSGIGQTVALTTTTGGITLNGVITAANDTLDLVSAGAISQSGGSINVATLTGSAVTGASLQVATNLVGTLAAFSSPAGFALTDNHALTVNGVINASGGTLKLVSTDSINQNGGSIDATALTGSATNSASLTQGGNLIGTLAAFTTGGGFALVDGEALTVNGLVHDTGAGLTVAITSNTGPIILNGAINAPGDTLDLISAGGILQTGGSIVATTLTGSVANSASLTAATNVVGTLAAFSSGTGFALTDGGPLLVNGVITDTGSGQTVALTTKSGDLTLANAINAPGDMLDLISAGAIIQTGGSIQVATLTGSIVAGASLQVASNLVGTLGAFSTASGFVLADNEALTVTGPVTDTGTGATVSLTTGNGDITLNGVISVANDTLNLISAGSIVQNAGLINVATLTGSVVSSATLASAANHVGTLGTFAGSAGFALTDSEGLLVNGVVTDSGVGKTVALTTLTGTGSSSITLTGTVNAAGDTLDLTSAAAISQTGGSIDVATLSVSAVGSATLTQAGNLVGALGAISTGGGFALTDNHGLTVGGVVTDTGTGATIVLTAGSGGLTLASAINAPNDTLDLISGGAISQTGGSIQVATLTGSAATLASLTQAGNLVGTLGPFTTTIGFALVDNQALVVNGTLSDTGAGQTVALTTEAGGITLSSAINAAGDTLDLVSAGAISQTGGSIDVATLTGGAVTSASLTQGGNLVGTLNGFSTGDGFALVDNEALTVAGAVTDNGTGRTVALTTEVGSLTLIGVVTAANDTLDLVSAGAISQTAGSIDVATLAGSAAGDVSLTEPNAIAALGVLATPFNGGFHAFSLTDVDALTVNGVTAASVTLTASSLTIPGAINGGNVSLTATSGSISETGGVTADLLTGSAATSAALTGANAVAGLGDFTATAGFSLTNTSELSVTGTVNGGSNVTLTDAAALTISGSVTGTTVGLTGADINFNGGAVDGPTSVTLTATTGVISESGSITTALLSGSAATVAELDGTNTITELGNFTATGGFSLNDIPALAVTGTVNGGSGAISGAGIFDTGALGIVGSVIAASVNLSGASIAISGAVSGPDSVMLRANTGGISEAGRLSTGNLTVNAAGNVVLTGTNTVATLGASTAATGFSLTDTSALSVTGTVNGGSNVTLTDAGALAISSTMMATTVALTGTSINISGAVNGPTSVALTATAGGIIETPNVSTAVTGSVSTAVLSGSATTNVTLMGAGNLVGTLNGFSTGAGFALVDNEALTVTGTVTDTGSAQTVALATETGGIMLTGVLSAVNDTVDLISAGAINQTGGQLDAAALTGSAVTSASLTQAGNLVGTLGGFTTTAGFALTGNEALVVNGAVTDSGSGQTVALTTGTGGITLTSPINAANDTLSLVAARGITQIGGQIDIAVLTGSASSAVSLEQAGNLVGTLAGFSSGAGFALVDNAALAVTGLLTDTGTGQTVALTTLAGALTLNGAINAANDTLALVSAGAVTQPAGSIDVAALTGSAATSASLTQPTNVVGTLGAFAAGGELSLTDNVPTLTIAGAVSGAGVTLNNTGGMTFAALSMLSAGATGTLTLNASGGPINASLGAITAGVLTDSVTTGGAATFTDLANAVATLGPFASTGTLSLTDHTALTLTGILSAPLIIVNTQTNPLTMAAGTTLVTSGTVAPNQLTITPGQVPTNPPPSNGVGAYFTSGAFTQLGTGNVAPITGSANTILSLSVVDGANVTFAGLTAPTTWLILGLDAAGSKVTGTVAVKSLTVVLPASSVPSDFSVTLQGTVGGVSGQEAAGEGGIIPTKGATIQFNNCPIGTVGCVLLSGVPVPAGSPLQFLTLGILVAPSDEGDLLLPLVSDEDFLTCLLRKDCN